MTNHPKIEEFLRSGFIELSPNNFKKVETGNNTQTLWMYNASINMAWRFTKDDEAETLTLSEFDPFLTSELKPSRQWSMGYGTENASNLLDRIARINVFDPYTEFLVYSVFDILADGRIKLDRNPRKQGGSLPNDDKLKPDFEEPSKPAGGRGKKRVTGETITSNITLEADVMRALRKAAAVNKKTLGKYLSDLLAEHPEVGRIIIEAQMEAKLAKLKPK